MVFASDARQDVDNELLTKTIIYRKYDKKIKDLSRDEQAENDSYNDYNIKAQCTVQSIRSRYVREGILNEGDLVGLFRYIYEKDSDGLLINPTLIPKIRDKIRFLNQWFVLTSITPATGEDDGVIGWDFNASQTGLESWEVDDYGDC